MYHRDAQWDRHFLAAIPSLKCFFLQRQRDMALFPSCFHVATNANRGEEHRQGMEGIGPADSATEPCKQSQRGISWQLEVGILQEVLEEPISVEMNRRRLHLKGELRNYMSRAGENSAGSHGAPRRATAADPSTVRLWQKQLHGHSKNRPNLRAEES